MLVTVGSELVIVFLFITKVYYLRLRLNEHFWKKLLYYMLDIYTIDVTYKLCNLACTNMLVELYKLLKGNI